MTKRTTGIAVGSILLLLAVAWLAASPYLALRSIRDALQNNDAATLNEHIDYDALRSNLKAQMAAMAAKAASQPNGGISAALMIGFGDKMVDTFIQPENLTGLLAGKHANAGANPAAAQGDGLNSKDIHVRRDSITTFSVATGDDKAATVQFRLEGLTWKLVGMDIPAGPAS